MGFSISKTFKKATKSVSKVVKTATKSVKKISQGKVAEGLGDLGQGAASMGLDIATGGNKSKVDALSGGFLSSAESAARGNSKDIARVGITGAATLAGGPAAGYAVNSVLANGGNYAEAAIAAGQGGDMSILSDVGGFLASDNPLAKLATNAISKATASPKSSPKVVTKAPAVQTISVPSDEGMSTGMMIGIGAVVLVAVVGLVLFLKRRK